MGLQNKKLYVGKILLPGILTFAVLMLLFRIEGIAPFGTSTLAVEDAKIQYMDFFAYLKDVMSGKNAISYTFGKTLGGSNVGVLSYYLTSPFNLLLVFFDRSQLNVFYDMSVALKLSLASTTFAYFSSRRFAWGEDVNAVEQVLLPMGYGLCQYNLAQSCNIMWLDGVYMLPLMLLQISNLVRGKKAWSLPLLVGMTILFNWYAAGMNCVYSGFWFLFEYALRLSEEKTSVRQFVRCAFQYVLRMLVGVMLSAVLFLPTIGALKRSTRGTLHGGGLIRPELLGNLSSALQNYTYGSKSDLGSAALFCGSLALVLAVYAIFSSSIQLRRRIVLAAFFVLTILFCYFRPLYTLFSLVQGVSSYHYRYSYVAIFSILVLAGEGSREVREKKQLKIVLLTALVLSAAIVLLNRGNTDETLKYVYLTAAVLLVEAALFSAGFASAGKQKSLLGILQLLVLVVGVTDLAINAKLLMERYSGDYVRSYQAYRAGQEQTIDAIQANDDAWYRITQTKTCYMGRMGDTTANYNEGLGYHYASVSGYTSTPDDNQRQFLDKLGYAICGENMCITNTSILGADSLLGVKYVLSPYSIEGLRKIKDEDSNGKAVYLNPYALPVAFTFDDSMYTPNETGNPFQYQNEIYKKLFGISEDLYTPLKWDIVRNEDGTVTKIRLEMPEASEAAVYGNIPNYFWADAEIYIDDNFATLYSRWTAPSVFYIPNAGNGECNIEVRSAADNFAWNQAQFYAMNLDVLKLCADKANDNAADEITVKNGSIEAYVEDAGEGEKLFLSVPADDGWTIQLNDRAAETETVGDCLYSIRLAEGENHIVMRYHVRYLKLGIGVSCLTLIAYMWVCMKNRRDKVGQTV